MRITHMLLTQMYGASMDESVLLMLFLSMLVIMVIMIKLSLEIWNQDYGLPVGLSVL